MLGESKMLLIVIVLMFVLVEWVLWEVIFYVCVLFVWLVYLIFWRVIYLVFEVGSFVIEVMVGFCFLWRVCVILDLRMWGKELWWGLVGVVVVEWWWKSRFKCWWWWVWWWWGFVKVVVCLFGVRMRLLVREGMNKFIRGWVKVGLVEWWGMMFCNCMRWRKVVKWNIW